VRKRVRKRMAVERRLLRSGWNQESGRMRFAPEVMSRRAAPSWMPLMMGTGMCRVRRRSRPVVLSSRTASDTSAPDAVTTSSGRGVARAAAAIACGRVVC
jgi:hypothetical protein